MAEQNNKNKPSVVIIFTGDGKGKTSASLGLLIRVLGNNKKVAFIQFIKSWQVNEDNFLKLIKPSFKDNLFTHKGGVGFYKAGELSAKNITAREHKMAVAKTYKIALDASASGKYFLVICDEINNALNDGLLTKNQLKVLIKNRHPNTNLCLTGRGFPTSLLKLADIATNMSKIKHHFDNGYKAIEGIDY